MPLTKQDCEIKDIQFKNFVNLTKEESAKILEWRNHELIRSMMITKDIIPTETHFLFLQKLINSSDKAYWVASYNGQKIGVVYLFEITNSSALWGYYLNPKFIGSGYGILLEYLILEIAFLVFKLSELSCESLTINKNVIKTHQVFGYSITEETGFCTIQTINFAAFEKHKKIYELLTRKFWE